MARGLDSTLLAHLEGDTFEVGSAVSVTVGGTTYRYTNFPFDITYDSNTYVSDAVFLGIGSIEENVDLVINNCSLAFSALDSAFVTTFGNTSVINAPVQIDMVFLDPTNKSVIGSPIVMFKGKVQNYTITDAQTEAILSLLVTSIFVNFDRANGRRTSLSNFQQEHPTDTGMEFSHESFEDIAWGRDV